MEYWETQCNRYKAEAEYYQEELRKRLWPKKGESKV